MIHVHIFLSSLDLDKNQHGLRLEVKSFASIDSLIYLPVDKVVHPVEAVHSMLLQLQSP